VNEHRSDPKLRIVEVDVDTTAYDEGHIPGAIAWNWNSQLCDTLRRDILSKAQFEALMMESGISPETPVILYGDNNNWFAAWAFWQMKIYGHRDVRIMNGGRKKWLEEGRELSKDVVRPSRSTYRAAEADLSLRAFLPDAQRASTERSAALVDVRVAKPPANGEITFQEVRARVEYPKDHFRAHCNGESVDAVKALYTSRENFTGTDRMQIEVDYKTGHVRRYSVIMDVR